MSRGDVVQILVEEIEMDPKSLLYSLAKALGNQKLIEHLEWISDVEDWPFKVDSEGRVYDSEKFDDGSKECL